ncbi:MAG TPA: hypothetical protein PKV73_01170 [Agriterribacter sp.]|nr:hypothetical protein [Agriterribacter sp.]
MSEETKEPLSDLPLRFKNELATPDMKIIDGYARFKHSVNPGDLYAAMGSIKQFYDATQRKVIIYQSTNHRAAYYPGAVHPTVNELGENVCMNKPMFEMIKPLIESQYYIQAFEEYHGQEIHFDLDIIRGKTNVNLPHGAITGWIPLAIPDLAFDCSQPWILLNKEDCPEYIKEQVNGKIIVNFTERYRNTRLNYFFLNKFAPDLIFTGTEREHWRFCNEWQMTIPHLQVNNFLDLAYALKESRFLLANQSQCWNLANAMGTPRILEICEFAQNCIHMIGAHNYGYLHQGALEYYFRKLDNIL